VAKCRYHEICGREAIGEDELCILHSKDPDKDKEAFAEALTKHCKEKRHNFSRFVFPESIDFSNAHFYERAKFIGAKFIQEPKFCNSHFHETAHFFRAEFISGADFSHAHFGKGAVFSRARFAAVTDFSHVVFTGPATFDQAKFVEDVYFPDAQFTRAADFSNTKFTGEADFGRVVFNGEVRFLATTFGWIADFQEATFVGRVVFSGIKAGECFERVDFRDVMTDMNCALIFRDMTLNKWYFQGTDLRKAEFTGVEWATIIYWLGSRREGVYDENLLLDDQQGGAWAHIERLYRELKQNYEDRRDYERAGDFHYGEKEMRRKNPKTAWGLWIFLNLYCWVSGYGERYLRPLLWAAGLWFFSALGYLGWGLYPKGEATKLAMTNVWDWLRAGFYSLRVMFLLKPDDFFPVGYAKLVHAGESLLGPLLIGLFALALRQRLKR
jgi:uncharacterized protein YjbI with pentapeptide repeats